MLIVCTLLVFLALAESVTTNPIAKVVSMISKLEQDVIKDGAEEQKEYNEFSEMCSDRSRELHQEIKAGKANIAELTAAMEKASADIDVLEEKISDSASQSSDAEAELKKATALRESESSDFKLEERDLQKTIGTVERSMAIIQREGPGASLAQVENMQSVAEVLQAMVDASTVDSHDAATLAALVQKSSDRSEEDSEEDEDEAGAPSAAAYKGQSGGIVEMLGGLLEKAQTQLGEARNTETKNKNAYEMLRQALADKLKTLARGMADAKNGLAATKEKKAVAEGDREASSKDLVEDGKELGQLHHECLEKATSFEDATASRDEELKALHTAKKIILESTGGAVDQSYDLTQISFMQVRSKARSSSSSSAASNAMHVIRRIALTLHSQAFMDLSNQISKSIQRSGSSGTDIFGKVKGMLDSMVSKLEAEAESAATKQAYCDKEMAETEASKEDKEDDVEKLSIKMDVMSASSKKLKGEVGILENELAALARTQAEMDKLRAETKANYNRNKPLMEQGLEGVKKALKVLREYYAKDDKAASLLQDASGDGGAAGIVGMLEVVESDFTKGLAEMVSAEESASAEHEAATKENNIARATKEKDVKFKTAEHVSLDKNIVESRADRAGIKDELEAVVQYFASIKKECVATPDTFAEKKKRREAEMAGLREAMQTLSGEVMLVQTAPSRKTLRGAL